MRDYNYRRHAKEKELKNYKRACECFKYKPRKPKKQQDFKGNFYYVEGSADGRKKFLKRQASKAVRKNRKMKVPKGSSYKKMYELIYQWY